METLGSKGLIKKSEFIRIIIDALNSLGFVELGAQLEQESDISLHSTVAKQFLQEVKNGEWDNSVATLQKFQLPDENPVKLLLLEQKFFELLKEKKAQDALQTLRNEMVPLGINAKRIGELAFELIKDTVSVISKSKVVEELQNLLPPEIICPERRLEYLVEESLDYQLDSCLYHNIRETDFSLFSNHYCGRDKVPKETVQILKEHKDEVWFVKFSHNGKYLASSSKDKTAIIWQMDEEGKFSVKHKLELHANPVVAVLWSPDDSEVITCGENEVIRRWNVDSGQCEHVYAKTEAGCVSCGWYHDGKGIIGGMGDKTICRWNLDGSEIENQIGQRAEVRSDVVMVNDELIFWLGKEPNEISIYHEKVSNVLIQEKDMITSFSVSKDNQYLLINLMNQEIHLWDIEENAPYMVVGFNDNNNSFVVRSCFGGYKESFIASGSEDSQVYIWHRADWREPFVLAGHSAAVRCVSWNSIHLDMLASASNDGTIRIWGLDN